MGTVSKLNVVNKGFISGHEQSHTVNMGTDKLLCPYKALSSFLNPSKQIFRGRSSRQSVKISKKEQDQFSHFDRIMCMHNNEFLYPFSG